MYINTKEVDRIVHPLISEGGIVADFMGSDVSLAGHLWRGRALAYLVSV